MPLLLLLFVDDDNDDGSGGGGGGIGQDGAATAGFVKTMLPFSLLLLLLKGRYVATRVIVTCIQRQPTGQGKSKDIAMLTWSI